MNYIIKNDNKGSPLSIYRGIVLAIVMMFLIAPLFNFGHKISTSLTDGVISVSNLNSGSKAETTISNSIVQSMVYTNETKPEDSSFLVNNWKTIDINATTGGVAGVGDYYKYSINFFMLIVLAIVTIFLLFFVALQMAKRVMEIALYKIIGPFCCTSLTNNGRAFETWCKSSMGLFLVTVVQFVSIGLLLAIFGTAFDKNNTITGIFLVIGALLFIIGTPNIINSLLNQQSGMMSAFGDMQSLMAIGQATSQGVSLATAGTMSALSFGANVIGKGTNVITGGANKISDMLHRNSGLNDEQKETFNDSFTNHNYYKAQEQMNEFLKDNNTKNKENVMNMDTSNPFKNPYSMRYNPLRNQYQYMNQSDNLNDDENDDIKRGI